MRYDKDMVKFLPVVVLVGLIIAVGLYLLRQQVPSTPVSPVVPSLNISDKISQTPSTATEEERIKVLEEAVIAVGKRTDELSGKLPVGSNIGVSNTDSRLKNLEKTITTLQGQIDQLKGANPSPVTQQTNSQKTPVYIPLASVVSAGDKSYYPIPSSGVAIDPANYSGYTSMQLELSMNFGETVGTAYASVYNSTDKTTVVSSEVSTTSSTPVLLSSLGFKLPLGQKTYQLQLKSTEGFAVYANNARIKVSF